MKSLSGLLKSDIRRSFTGRGFWVAQIFSAIIIIAYYMYMIKYFEAQDQAFEDWIARVGNIPLLPPVMSQAWIGTTAVSVHNHLFYNLLFCIAACLPGASALYREKKTGYSRNVVSRCGHVRYRLSKYISGFIVGGTAVTIPALISFMIALAWFPAIPEPANSFQSGIGYGSMFAEIFYSKPVLYIIIFLVLDFFAGGMIASMGQMFTYHTRSVCWVLTGTFIINLLFQNFASVSKFFSSMVPINFVNPTQPYGGIFWVTLMCLTAYIVISFVYLVICCRKKDIF